DVLGDGSGRSVICQGRQDAGPPLGVCRGHTAGSFFQTEPPQRALPLISIHQDIRSLERTLQRPLLAKSRTLPSIPQSPAAPRVHHSDLIGGSPPGRIVLPPISNQPKACTLPPAGPPVIRDEE
ncbi:hypothetical protein NHX12_024520, partial [Muraenolepis orangiensis]